MRSMKNIKWMPSLMAITILVIAGFQVYWLNKAYESKDWSLNRVGVEPWIDNIGSDPRLADLVRRMGLNP